MTRFGRRLARAAGVALAGVLAAAGPATAAYPERPVTIIVPFPAGGATDLLMRAMQEAHAKALGGTTVVKNVVGASGTLGAAEAAAAAPDGYTIMTSPIGPVVIQPHRMKLTYELASWEPVCKLVDSPVVLMVPGDSKLRTVKDMIEAGKADPARLTHGTAGPGTIPHMAQIALAKALGLPIKHVPYKGSADVVQAMLSGTIAMTSEQPNLIAQYSLHPVAVFAERRIPTFPDTPTLKEAGYDIKLSIWNAMLAPKGTPEPVLAKLEAACKAALDDKGVIDALDKQKQPIDYRDRKGLAAFLAEEYRKSRQLLEEAGLVQK